jgi:hypothetical protein
VTAERSGDGGARGVQNAVMLSRFDDFPLHQVPRPVTQPGTTDKNAYDRYWFGASARDGSFMVEAAFGRYPNLQVQDASVSISAGGVQQSFHASRLAPLDPGDTTVGPLRIEITEPLRALRIAVEPNETGIECDLHWRARTGALLEDHTVIDDGPLVVVDMSRFVQFGSWEGTFTVDGTTTELRHDDVVGVRDRSWGIRPVGAQPPGRPSLPSFCWLWAPLHFADECRILGWFQRPGGEFLRPDGHVIGVRDPVPESVSEEDPDVRRLVPVDQRLDFEPGSRWVRGAQIDARTESGSVETVTLETVARFHMRGIGYSSPDWGHGVWHDDLAVGRDDWKLADVAPGDPYHQHVHNLVLAKVGDRVGIGILEQIIFGAHTQFGFHDFLDGAPG